jgi:hypothetical protein
MPNSIFGQNSLVVTDYLDKIIFAYQLDKVKNTGQDHLHHKSPFRINGRGISHLNFTFLKSIHHQEKSTWTLLSYAELNSLILTRNTI